MSQPADFANFQNEIYLGGLMGQTPPFPVSWAALERAAEEAMTPEAWGYVGGSAGTEDTARANLEAFRRWRIVPRHLRDVSVRDLSTELFGAQLRAPVLLAPVGVQGIVHPDRELAVARAAASMNVPMVLSTAATASMEEVAEANGDGLRWYQLYWPRDPELTKSFLKRAEANGYSAVVITLDTFILAWRPRDLQSAYLPFLKGEGIQQYLADPVFREGLPEPLENHLQDAALKWVQVFSDPSTTWDRLAFVRENTSLPILLKGILHPDDARKAIDHGMDGVIVSNHGGRQVDGSIGALDALPGVVEAVAGKIPVLFDSGIRSGADAVKAIALGAKAVLLGRPYIWGLAIGGEEGVRHVLRCFLAEMELTMALSGTPTLADLTPDTLTRIE
ncbi:MAG: lactate 2-monooxygenase [Actinomycetota bacterium]